jgi:hypothetical protein
MVAALTLPLFGLLQRVEVYALLAAAALFLSVLGLRMLRGAGLRDIDLRRGFAGINLFALLTMILLVVDRVIRP